MASCKCVYLHGFLSSHHSQKAQWFKQTLPSLVANIHPQMQCQVLTPNYPMRHPHESVDYLEHAIKQAGLVDLEHNKKWFLVGSSMGGFYAQYLGHAFNRPYIMINPALDPIGLFTQYQGTHVNPHTQEIININQWYRDDLKDYYQHPSQEIASLLLLDRGDEVIDYQIAQRLYSVKQPLHKTQVFEGGDHAFQNLDNAKAMIQKFVKEAVLHIE